MALARVRGPGHPDQICDLIAASIVEEYLKRDPVSQLNVRASGGHGVVFVAGEVQSAADFDVAAVVRRVAAGSGVQSPIEPFIAFEPMAPAWAPPSGARDVTHVFGYATVETESRLPRAAHLAREAGRELEFRRTQDPDWFWLGSDYEVTVEDGGSKPSVVVRAEHLDSHDISSVRLRIAAVLRNRLGDAEWRVNPAGEELLAGLSARMGSSATASSVDQFGTSLPSNASGVGRHILHPLNAGAWIARRLARSLVSAGQGKAVLVNASWRPLESKPYQVRVRNERGADLSANADPSQFDLAALPESFRDTGLITAVVRAPFEQSAVLPWES